MNSQQTISEIVKYLSIAGTSNGCNLIYIIGHGKLKSLLTLYSSVRDREYLFIKLSYAANPQYSMLLALDYLR